MPFSVHRTGLAWPSFCLLACTHQEFCCITKLHHHVLQKDLPGWTPSFGASVASDACILLRAHNNYIEIMAPHVFCPLGCEIRFGDVALNLSESSEPRTVLSTYGVQLHPPWSEQKPLSVCKKWFHKKMLQKCSLGRWKQTAVQSPAHFV